MNVKGSDMEKIFCLSKNGLKLYEKHGIVDPEHQDGNNYRRYGTEDLQLMGAATQFRAYGFSMQATKNLLRDYSEDQQVEAMTRRQKELEWEIDALERASKSLSAEIRLIEAAKSLEGRCVFERNTPLYFFAMRRGEQFVDDRVTGLSGEWLDKYAPHTSSAVLMDGPYFTNPDFHNPPLYGISVDARIALDIGIELSEYVTYMPPKDCIRTAVRFDYGAPDFTGVARLVDSYAKSNHMHLQGGGVIRIAQTLCKNNRVEALGVLAVPLYGDEKNFGSMK